MRSGDAMEHPPPYFRCSSGSESDNRFGSETHRERRNFGLDVRMPLGGKLKPVACVGVGMAQTKRHT